MKYAASPETMPAAMEVPVSSMSSSPTWAAHLTSTAGPHTLTRRPRCECSYSTPYSLTPPTTIISGYKPARRAGHWSTLSERPGSPCYGQFTLFESDPRECLPCGFLQWLQQQRRVRAYFVLLIHILGSTRRLQDLLS